MTKSQKRTRSTSPKVEPTVADPAPPASAAENNIEQTSIPFAARRRAFITAVRARSHRLFKVVSKAVERLATGFVLIDMLAVWLSSQHIFEMAHGWLVA